MQNNKNAIQRCVYSMYTRNKSNTTFIALVSEAIYLSLCTSDGMSFVDYHAANGVSQLIESMGVLVSRYELSWKSSAIHA